MERRSCPDEIILEVEDLAEGQSIYLGNSNSEDSSGDQVSVAPLNLGCTAANPLYRSSTASSHSLTRASTASYQTLLRASTASSHNLLRASTASSNNLLRASTASSNTLLRSSTASSMASSQTLQRASSSENSRNSTLWMKAGRAATMLAKASSSFKTLRDMHGENVVEATSLEKISDLGEGAFARVEKDWYRPESGERYVVAVKRLLPAMSQHQDIAQFVQETALLRKLQHRGIVQYVGIGSFDRSSEEAAASSLFLVQEYMNAGTLKRLVQHQMLQAPRPIYSYADALRWSLNVARGLQYLHTSIPMVIHRDLKLANILLKGSCASDYEAKLSDFGLSALLKANSKDTNSARLPDTLERKLSAKIEGRLTRSMSRKVSAPTRAMLEAEEGPPYLSGRCGSLMYMAPEVFNNQLYNEKADVFSFGVVMYELFQRYITIMAVLMKGTPEEVQQYARRVSEGYRPPLSSSLPLKLRELVDDCRAHVPAARPSMEQVVNRLVEIEESGVLKELDNVTVPACRCSIS